MHLSLDIVLQITITIRRQQLGEQLIIKKNRLDDKQTQRFRRILSMNQSILSK